MSYSLNKLFKAVGVTKQAFHQQLDRQQRENAQEHPLLFLVYDLRNDHPTMGCRDMYHLIQPGFMGRDAFERFCRQYGLMSERPINYRRTTDSSGVIRFKNLTVGLELVRINQLWVSDITYYEVLGRFYYLTFIMDAYSRRILGYSVSKRLFTEHTTLVALTMAVRTRSPEDLEGTILHSDGGGQYYDREFLKETSRLRLINSMCEYPWENGKAERINGVIKNNYLKHREINTETELIHEVDRSIKLYNESKPHIKLKRLSPVNFERLYIDSQKISSGSITTFEYE